MFCNTLYIFGDGEKATGRVFYDFVGGQLFRNSQPPLV